jgi:hypothetical protein
MARLQGGGLARGGCAYRRAQRKRITLVPVLAGGRLVVVSLETQAQAQAQAQAQTQTQTMMMTMTNDDGDDDDDDDVPLYLVLDWLVLR